MPVIKQRSKYAKENQELTEPDLAAHDYGLLKERKFNRIGSYLSRRRWEPKQVLWNKFRRQSLDEIRRTVSDLRGKLNEAYAERERAVKEVNAVDLPECLIPKHERARETTVRLLRALEEGADEPMLNRLQAERDEACGEERRAFEEVNSEPVDEQRLDRVRAYAYGFHDYQWTDLKLHVAEVAEYFLDDFGGAAGDYDYYRALTRYENPPDYENDPRYDPKLGFDVYEWRYVEYPGSEDRKKLLNEAFGEAWNYAKQLLEGGQIRDFEGYRRISEEEVSRIEEQITSHDKVIQRYHQEVIDHKGNEYVLSKREDRLKHEQNWALLLAMRREALLYRLNAMRAVEKRHLVGLQVQNSAALTKEQREAVKRGRRPTDKELREERQRNLVKALLHRENGTWKAKGKGQRPSSANKLFFRLQELDPVWADDADGSAKSWWKDYSRLESLTIATLTEHALKNAERWGDKSAGGEEN